jgi:hypothetical protein
MAPVFHPKGKEAKEGHPGRVPSGRPAGLGITSRLIAAYLFLPACRSGLKGLANRVRSHRSRLPRPCGRPPRSRAIGAASGTRDHEPADRRVSIFASLQVWPQRTREQGSPTGASCRDLVGANPVRESFGAGRHRASCPRQRVFQTTRPGPPQSSHFARRYNDKLPRYGIAPPLTPRLDRFEISHARTNSRHLIESRPGQRNRTTDKRRMASLIGIGIIQRG